MTAVITADPKQLVEAYKQGDATAFDEIVRCYYEGLFTHALRRLGDAHAAEDAVQETLVRAYGALHRFNGQYHLRAWLHRILSNVCHDEGGRRHREMLTVERLAGSEVDPVIDDMGEDVLDRLAVPRVEVLDALAALPEPYRRALVLRYVDELSFREVAEATGVTEGNARARVHRARAALKRTLGASLALLAWLVPVLRRAERTAVAETGSSVHAGLAATQAAPTLSRFADAAVIDRVASLAGSLGIAASLAVPVGVSHVADRVSPPAPPAVLDVHAAQPPASVVTPAAAAGATATTASPSRSDGAPASAGAGSGAAQPSSTTAAPAPSDVRYGVPERTAGSTAPGPRKTATAAPAPSSSGDRSPSSLSPGSAPARIKTFALESGDLSATTSWRTDLAGRVRVKLGDQVLAGNLVGVLEAEPRPAAESSQQPTAGDSSSTSSTTSTTNPPAPQPRRFTSDITVRLDDGRVVRLRMAGTLLDGDAGMKATGEVRAFDEVCAVELGTAKLAGSIVLRDAPLLSSLGLTLDGVALDDAATSKSSCAGATNSAAAGAPAGEEPGAASG